MSIPIGSPKLKGSKGMRLGCSARTTMLYSQLKDGGNRQLNKDVSKAPFDLNTLVKTIKWVSKLGLHSMDLEVLNENYLSELSKEDNSKAVEGACRDYSVEISHVSCDFVSSWAFRAESTAFVDRMWSSITTFACSVGTSTIDIISVPVQPNGKINFGTQFNWDKIWKKFVESTTHYSRIANESTLRLAIEPRPRELISNTDSLLRLFDSIPMENMGAIADIGYMIVVREIPVISIRKLGKKIFGVRLNDNDGVTESRWPPRLGTIDWPAILNELLAAGFGGLLSVDVFGIDVEEEAEEGIRFIQNVLRTSSKTGRRGRYHESA
jgi:sugar phosphate isomerase/epimerase